MQIRITQREAWATMDKFEICNQTKSVYKVQTTNKLGIRNKSFNPKKSMTSHTHQPKYESQARPPTARQAFNITI
ncbi:hypothetical protein GCM10009332_25270 [Shewanella gelidii]|uniref:Uncharacterized protein n=1 Tax=Shewanella gelidii TaxID=1642821 RepID=A0A917JUB3_9GAMM|nr:hypothetical protein GCM10009332_25270 [Shewanella gelidii]